ncbi:DUF4998 domain-containing protein [Niabella terrae]
MKFITYITCFAVLMGIVSCDKFTDVHKKYIEDGEIVYAVKPDSIVFYSGKERLKMKLWIENGVNVKEVVVRWNSGADSMTIPVSFGAGRDSMEVYLNDLVEKSYTFDISSIDAFGNRSLIYTQFGSAYGDVYASSLINRRLKQVTLTEENASLEWFAAQEGMVLNEIKFTDKEGQPQQLKYSSGLFTTVIPAKAGTAFQYRSYYIPQQGAIDSFYTDWAEGAIPELYLYDRSDWEVIAVSDETASDGGGKTTLIDGDLGSYWHSQWDPDNAPLPHWAIIDMKTTKNLGAFDIYRRRGNGDSKTVQIFAGTTADPNGTWTLAAEGDFVSGDLLSLTATPGSSGRYLKIYLPNSNRDPFTSIAEVYVYGN